MSGELVTELVDFHRFEVTKFLKKSEFGGWSGLEGVDYVADVELVGLMVHGVGGLEGEEARGAEFVESFEMVNQHFI